MVDNQNQNARYLDKYGSGTSSVRLHAPPGGKSSLSLGWGDSGSTNDYKKNDTSSVYNNNNSKFGNNKTNDYGRSNKSNDIFYHENQNQNQNQNDRNFQSMNNKKNVNTTNNIGGIHQGNDNKTSVRVRHAPGGESSIKFG